MTRKDMVTLLADRLRKLGVNSVDIRNDAHSILTELEQIGMLPPSTTKQKFDSYSQSTIKTKCNEWD